MDQIKALYFLLTAGRIISPIPAVVLERVSVNVLRSCICVAAILLGTPHSAGAFQTLPVIDSTAASVKTVTISGIVLDKTNQRPVPYASVTASSNKSSTQTNSKGAFALPLNAQNLHGSIQITSLGYTSQEVSIAGLLKEKTGITGVKLFLEPKQERLREVEVKTKAGKWKTKKIGYHIDEGSPFHYEFSPSDTVTAVTPGQQIGNRIYLKNQLAFLQRVSFGLAGSGGEKVAFGIHLYSLKDNLPYRDLLPKPVVITVPPHHTGWITVDLAEYNLTLKEDFAVVIEWLTETNRLNSSTLIAFATQPEEQITYYRESDKEPWKIVKSGLLNVKSIGLYATLLYKK